MTLHWWMHWFWVTTLLTVYAGSVNAFATPQAEQEQTTVDVQTDQRHAQRQGRAMYFTKSIQLTTTSSAPVANATNELDKENTTITNTSALNVTADIVHPSFHWTPVNTSDLNVTSDVIKDTNVATTLLDTNLTETQNVTTKKRNLTRPDYIQDNQETNLEGISESKIVTEKPLSLETTYLQTKLPSGSIESSRRVIDPEDGGMDTGAIAGIAFAALVLTALAGSTAFILYRRRYLNKPQTLNDKCSNPDSSGYLDDSTIRDNSEEMYSLDNDSFLNSLEAMTIQNYWTDTVKHTKL